MLLFARQRPGTPEWVHLGCLLGPEGQLPARQLAVAVELAGASVAVGMSEGVQALWAADPPSRRSPAPPPRPTPALLPPALRPWPLPGRGATRPLLTAAAPRRRLPQHCLPQPRLWHLLLSPALLQPAAPSLPLTPRRLPLAFETTPWVSGCAGGQAPAFQSATVRQVSAAWVRKWLYMAITRTHLERENPVCHTPGVM